MKTIFLEGGQDEKFIKSILNKIGVKDDEYKINTLNGSDIVLLERRIIEIKASTDKGWKNKIILDANGSFDRRREEFSKFISEKKLEAELFLIPNNELAGNLEDLLERIIPSDKANVLSCFENYRKCIVSLGYKGPFPKSKIFAYIEAVSSSLSKPEIDEAKKNIFSNSLFWNFDSEELDNLKLFLTK